MLVSLYPISHNDEIYNNYKHNLERKPTKLNYTWKIYDNYFTNKNFDNF